jgi:hypothetical protein
VRGKNQRRELSRKFFGGAGQLAQNIKKRKKGSKRPLTPRGKARTTCSGRQKEEGNYKGDTN